MSEGKQCNHCGDVKPLDQFHKDKARPDGRKARCKACINLSNKSRSPERKREIAERQALWRESNPGKGAEITRRWRVNNPERAKDSRKKEYRKDPAKEKARSREWRKRNPERLRHHLALYRARHPEVYRAASQRRYALKSKAETKDVTAKDLHRILASSCVACGEERVELDHIIPLSRGGRHSVGNLQPLCRGCNGSKKDLLMVEWREKQHGCS